MGRLGQIIGVVLLAAGAGLAAWGAPYYMLDWGGTFVMAGVALASAGLSCVLLGTILIKLSGLRAEISALRAEAAINRHESVLANAATTATAPDTNTMLVATRDDDEAQTGGTPATPGGYAVGAAVAGAAVAAGGLAYTARTILTSVEADPQPMSHAYDAAAANDHPPVDQTESDHAENDLVGTGVSGSDEFGDVSTASTSGGLTLDDRASLDDLLARLSLPLSKPGQEAASTAEPDPLLDNSDTISAAPTQAGADAYFTTIDAAAAALKDEAADAAMRPGDPADVALVRTHTSAPDIDEPFAALRAELAKDDNAKATSAADRSGDEDFGNLDHPETVAAWDDDPMPAPKAEIDPAQAHGGDTASASDADAVAEENTPSNEGSAAPAPVASSEAPDSQPKPDQAEPASSDEGVVAAYNVGDTSYAMFVDGRIRVSTPEGQFMLESMDELKSFMAARRAPT